MLQQNNVGYICESFQTHICKNNQTERVRFKLLTPFKGATSVNTICAET